MANTRQRAERGADRRAATGRSYERPEVVRVRVDTARLKTGYQDANSFCTIHIHDDSGAGQPCEFV